MATSCGMHLSALCMSTGLHKVQRVDAPAQEDRLHGMQALSLACQPPAADLLLPSPV